MMTILQRIALAGLILVFTGCVRSTEDERLSDGGSRIEKKEHGRVAVVVSTLNNPWFVVLAEAAKGRIEELGHKAAVFDSQNDVAKEAATFENVLSAGYDAILLNAVDSEASIANVRSAKEKGVPVFCIDREVNATDAAAAQILSDGYAGCVELAQHFVEVVGEEGEYAEILGLSGDNNTSIRSEGFHSVVDRYDGLKMVAQQSADFDRTKGLEVMEVILQGHPKVQAVFCGNDAMALGAYQAIEAAGKEDQVRVFGFDGAEDVVQSIAEGKITATAMQFPKTMARQGAEFADARMKGKRDFEQKIPVAVELVTSENVARYGDYGAKE